MNEIIKILMERDNLSYDEAKEVFDDVKAQAEEIFNRVGGTLDELEDLLSSELGLEPDYIFDIVDL